MQQSSVTAANPAFLAYVFTTSLPLAARQGLYRSRHQGRLTRTQATLLIGRPLLKVLRLPLARVEFGGLYPPTRAGSR